MFDAELCDLFVTFEHSCCHFQWSCVVCFLCLIQAGRTARSSHIHLLKIQDRSRAKESHRHMVTRPCIELLSWDRGVIASLNHVTCLDEFPMDGMNGNSPPWSIQHRKFHGLFRGCVAEAWVVCRLSQPRCSAIQRPFPSQEYWYVSGWMNVPIIEWNGHFE